MMQTSCLHLQASEDWWCSYRMAHMHGPVAVANWTVSPFTKPAVESIVNTAKSSDKSYLLCSYMH